MFGIPKKKKKNLGEESRVILTKGEEKATNSKRISKALR